MFFWGEPCVRSRFASAREALLGVPLTLYKDEERDPQFRVSCVENFLIPILNCLTPDMVEQFYEREMEFLLETLKSELCVSDSRVSFRRIVQKKIGWEALLL